MRFLQGTVTLKVVRSGFTHIACQSAGSSINNLVMRYVSLCAGFRNASILLPMDIRKWVALDMFQSNLGQTASGMSRI